MVEGVIGPGDGVVARGAIGSGEGCPSGGMRRVIRLLPGGQVAAGITAIGWLNVQ
jgi:hypothetical protein